MILETAMRNTIAAAFAAIFNTGGYIKGETSGDVEVCTNTFSGTAFGAASGGAVTANAIADDTAATGGTIEHFSLYKADNSKQCELSATVTGGGGDMTGSSLVIGASDTVKITALVITCPAS